MYFMIQLLLPMKPIEAQLVEALLDDVDHPADSEAIGQHTESRREECLAQGHRDLTAVGQRVKESVCVGGLRDRDRQRKTFVLGISPAVAVGCVERRLSDRESRMHDFVLGAGWQNARRRRFGAVLV